MLSRYSGWVTATTRTLRPAGKGSSSLARLWLLLRRPRRGRRAISASRPGLSVCSGSTASRSVRRRCSASASVSLVGRPSAASSSNGLTRLSKSCRPKISTGTPARASRLATSGIRLACLRAPLKLGSSTVRGPSGAAMGVVRACMAARKPATSSALSPFTRSAISSAPSSKSGTTPSSIAPKRFSAWARVRSRAPRAPRPTSLIKAA
mmetsp:Transcript_18216/g.43695  ORF Transcript_18216/g.43695 Transcript_18216/m.43695 type:complete len:208 (+) Transcript_18216:100-723(+)